MRKIALLHDFRLSSNSHGRLNPLLSRLPCLSQKSHWLFRLDIQTHLSFLPFQRIRNNLKRFLCYKCLLKKYRFSVDGRGRDDNVKYLYDESFSGEPLLCLSAQLKPTFGKRPPHAGFAAGCKKVLLACQVVKKSSFPQKRKEGN